MTSPPSKAFDNMYRCAVSDCSSATYGGARYGLCIKHHQRVMKHGDIVTVKPRGGVAISDETRAEIVKAVRHFESPLSVCKRLGVSPSTVSRVMRASQ